MSVSLNKLLTTKQAEPYAGLAAGTLENKRTTGEGPRYIKIGNRVFYDPADIQTWLEARKVHSTSERIAA